MDIDIENLKSDISNINQRIKGFLWKTKYWKKNNRFR